MKIQESNFFKTILTGKKITLYFTTELIYVIFTIIVKTRDEMINLSEKRRRNFQECIITLSLLSLESKKRKNTRRGIHSGTRNFNRERGFLIGAQSNQRSKTLATFQPLNFPFHHKGTADAPLDTPMVEESTHKRLGWMILHVQIDALETEREEPVTHTHIPLFHVVFIKGE